MSEENIELAQRLNAAFNAGDTEAWIGMCAPDAELQDLASAPDQQSVVRGTDAIRQALALWTDAFDELRADIEEYTAAGDAVVCAAHWIGQGKASGISIDLRQFDLWEFHDGRVVRAVLGYTTKEEALEAAAAS
jgi:ketosteroid isomerase-like protein